MRSDGRPFSGVNRAYRCPHLRFPRLFPAALDTAHPAMPGRLVARRLVKVGPVPPIAPRRHRPAVMLEPERGIPYYCRYREGRGWRIVAGS